MTRYGFAIDTTRCLGCHGCAIACKCSNNVPDGAMWNRILTKGGLNIDVPEGAYPNLTMSYRPVMCQHCENPACVKACPVGATYKDPETGAVRQDYDRCIGCRMCMAACPYTGVRNFNWLEPAYATPMATGEADVPAHQKHTVEKCTMCYQRITQGEQPACIEVCPGEARFWGDLDDPSSEVSQLIARRDYEQLLPEKGTRPSVYYLV